MKKALEVADKSGADVPVGAVIVKNGKILASSSNKREKSKKISSHAEIIVIEEAEKTLENWRLEDCELYVTLEPCPMCAWAILQSGIKSVYFGSFNKQYGAFGSAVNLVELSNFKTQVYGGILEDECDIMLNDFWKKKRGNF